MTVLPLPAQEIYGYVRLVQRELIELGYALGDGEWNPIELQRVLVSESGSILLIELDTERLQRKVWAEVLASEQVLHHLATAVQHPVHMLNTTGITLGIMLNDPQPRSQLPDKVYLADALAHHPGTPLTFPIGAGQAGPVWGCLDGHWFVGGTAGSGKTTWLRTVVESLARTECHGSLQIFAMSADGDPSLAPADTAQPVYSLGHRLEEAAAGIVWIVQQMEERRMMQYRGVSSRGFGPAKPDLPYILIVIDEVVDLLRCGPAGANLYENLLLLSRDGPCWRICLLLSTKNLQAEVLPPLLRQGEWAGRVCFRVETAAESVVTLGIPGGETLPHIPGRMLALQAQHNVRKIQGYQAHWESK